MTNPIPLTKSQQLVASSVLEELVHVEGKKLILIEGISGVGKDHLVDSIKIEIGTKGAIILPSHSLDFYHPEDVEGRFQNDGNYIAAVTPIQARWTAEGMNEHLPQVLLSNHVLKGMSLDEAIAYTKNLGVQNCSLSNEAIANYSLGIPLLAQMLAGYQDINLFTAKRIAAAHLSHTLDPLMLEDADTITKYIQTPLPDGLVEAARKITPFSISHIYEIAPDIIQNLLKISKKGFKEESPFFLAKESEEIYTKMFQHCLFSEVDFSIFIPELKPDDSERILRALDIIRYPDFIDRASDRSSRILAFGNPAAYRKAGVWLRDGNLEGVTDDEEDGYISQKARKLEDEYIRNQLPLKPKNRNGSRILFHKHEHSELRDGIVRVGWALESLLQHRGIPYIVFNGVVDKNYFYEPSKNKIKFFQ
ncbi:hypothetical protein HYS31_03525 [Candidatus Woesearchaeota archaeon]|nr:hypothetical protein [Candidatus Woesearchaeota archaeon]